MKRREFIGRSLLGLLAVGLGVVPKPAKLQPPASVADKIQGETYDYAGFDEASPAFEDIRKWGVDTLEPETVAEIIKDPTVRQLGRTFQLEDRTLYVKREAFMMEFFAYETQGVVLCSSRDVALAKFV